MGENTAIIKAGSVNTNLTRKSAFFTLEKALAICGNAGEMVITDIMVRLLTRRSVSFNFHFLFSMSFVFSAKPIQHLYMLHREQGVQVSDTTMLSNELMPMTKKYFLHLTQFFKSIPMPLANETEKDVLRF